MPISPLYAGLEGDPLNSTGEQIASTVNALINITEGVPQSLFFDKATLDLNFIQNNHKVYEPFGLTNKILSDAVATTRNSTANYQSPTVVATAAINTPRITYDATTGNALGLLAEEQRTNLLLHSQYTAASGETPPTGWVISGTTGVTTTVASPRFAGAIRTTQSGTAQREYYTHTVTLPAATTYTLSCFFAAGTVATDRVMSVNTIDTPTGTTSLLGSAVLSAGVYSITFTTGAGGNYSVRIGLGCFDVATGTVIHETPQLEAGPAATSYIPTTTAQVTRVADVISRALTTTNANAGAIFCEFDLTSYDKAAGQATIVKLVDSGNSVNRGFGLVLINNAFSAFIRNASANNSISVAVADSLLPVKALVSFDNTTLKVLVAINGVTNELTLGAPIDLAGFVSNLFFSGGSGMGGTFAVHSKTVKRCTYFPRSFTAAEAQAITA